MSGTAFGSTGYLSLSIFAGEPVRLEPNVSSDSYFSILTSPFRAAARGQLASRHRVRAHARERGLPQEPAAGRPVKLRQCGQDFRRAAGGGRAAGVPPGGGVWRPPPMDEGLPQAVPAVLCGEKQQLERDGKSSGLPCLFETDGNPFQLGRGSGKRGVRFLSRDCVFSAFIVALCSESDGKVGSPRELLEAVLAVLCGKK
jgi:hypothetical protein